ncbi:sigma-70 family RNA polymerase sigma factor [Agilicoccus flavus]|uniref:sigma-70 family RNA polymerase sigma factor n=1 Tax=Agilicoccus flavus TaxID=2775968 RepID=UPI001CF6735C|nr:sigma-70 family RNA polymerase sigma factor [Agilicoccus flavus]
MPGTLFSAAAHLPTWLDGRKVGDLDPTEREARTDELLAEALNLTGNARQGLLDQVVLINGPVAESIASRYRSRGIDSDDLTQVAYLGLVKAAQGYRPGEGPGFLAYAVPTISGEVKRHFRDFGWMIRPPRRLQELRSAALSAAGDLLQSKGRPATSEEIAEVLGVSVAELAEAEIADRGYSALSIDAPGPGEDGPVLADLLVDDADSYRQVENLETLRPVLDALDERDRRILLLRFVRGMTQEQIGTEIGVSQMQVSRLLTRILTSLRRGLTDEDGVPAHV